MSANFTMSGKFYDFVENKKMCAMHMSSFCVLKCLEHRFSVLETGFWSQETLCSVVMLVEPKFAHDVCAFKPKFGHSVCAFKPKLCACKNFLISKVNDKICAPAIK